MNKKTYMLPGDERIVAGNAKEFVHELRVGSWMDSDCTDEQYMHNFAERYVVQSGVRIATDTPEKFLADLIRTGYAKEMYRTVSFIITPSPFSFHGKMGIFIWINTDNNIILYYVFK